MKKVLTSILAASLLLLGTNAFAQISVGGGYVNSTMVSKAGSSSSTSEPSNGFYAGIGYTLPIAGDLQLTPGVYYEMLFGKNVKEGYIDIPFHFSYDVYVGNAKVFAYAGPTVSCGLFSKGSLSILGMTIEGDRYGENSGYGRFDVLLGGGVGMELNDMIRFNVGYNFGMLNRNTSSLDYKLSRNVLTAGVSFLF